VYVPSHVPTKKYQVPVLIVAAACVFVAPPPSFNLQNCTLLVSLVTRRKYATPEPLLACSANLKRSGRVREIEPPRDAHRATGNGYTLTNNGPTTFDTGFIGDGADCPASGAMLGQCFAEGAKEYL
jgi:hypothetical protein